MFDSSKRDEKRVTEQVSEAKCRNEQAVVILSPPTLSLFVPPCSVLTHCASMFLLWTVQPTLNECLAEPSTVEIRQ